MRGLFLTNNKLGTLIGLLKKANVEKSQERTDF